MTIPLTHDAPQQIVAGDSIEFLVAIPPDLAGYTGSARLTGPSQMAATSVATENSDFHVKFEGQSTGGTKTLSPGQYALTVWATSGNDRYTVFQARVSVTLDLSTGTPAQQHAIKMLPIVEAEIEARITGNGSALSEYGVDGTTVHKMEMAELQKLRAKYSSEISAIQNPGRPIPQVKFAFTPAGAPINLARRFS